VVANVSPLVIRSFTSYSHFILKISDRLPVGDSLVHFCFDSVQERC